MSYWIMLRALTGFAIIGAAIAIMIWINVDGVANYQTVIERGIPVQAAMERGIPEGAVRCPNDPDMSEHNGYESPYSWPDCETKLGARWVEPDYYWEGGYWVKNSELTEEHFEILRKGNHVWQLENASSSLS
jgi:hypothetical protein